MAEVTQSKHKLFAVTESKGWAEVVMELKQEAGIAAGGRKRRRGKSDIGWQVKEKQLQGALKPGMLVAVYCGTGTSADSSSTPYWLAHVKGTQGGAAKFKVKSAFSSCGIPFRKNQWAVDLTQLDFKAVDRSGHQQHTRTDAVCAVGPVNLLPVPIKESSPSTNYVHIHQRAHARARGAARCLPLGS
jgi:hypothetical protein